MPAITRRSNCIADFPETPEAEAWQFVEASRSAETMAEFQGLLLALEREGHPDFAARIPSGPEGAESPKATTEVVSKL